MKCEKTLHLSTPFEGVDSVKGLGNQVQGTLLFEDLVLSVTCREDVSDEV